MLLFNGVGTNMPEMRISEKDLQNHVQLNVLQTIGIDFLASEINVGTGKLVRRPDSIGIDMAGCPVIIEYKQNICQGIMDQAEEYMELLLQNKLLFEELVRDKLQKPCSYITWDHPRIICISKKFHEYDLFRAKYNKYAVDLLEYTFFEHRFLVFNQVHGNVYSRSYPKPEYSLLHRFLQDIAYEGIGSNVSNLRYGRGLDVCVYTLRDNAGINYKSNNQGGVCKYCGDCIAINIEKMYKHLNKTGHSQHIYDLDTLVEEINTEFLNTLENEGNGLVLAPHGFRITSMHNKKRVNRFYTLFRLDKLLEIAPLFADIKWEGR